MNIGQLRYFVSAFEEKSFSAAARKQFVTVQAVSKSIADLERELGQELFSRGGSSIAPTDFGAAFYQRALPVLEHFNELESFPEEYENMAQDGSLKFFLCSPAFNSVGQLLENLSLLLTRSVGRPAECRLARVDEAMDKLYARKVDVVITLGEYSRPGVDSLPVGTMPTGVVFSDTHPLASHETVRIDELQPYPVILASVFADFGAAVLELYRQRGLASPVVEASGEQEAADVGRFLSEDHGYAFCVTITALFEDLEGVAMRPFCDEDSQALPLYLNSLSARRGSLDEVYAKLLPNLKLLMSSVGTGLE